MRRPRTGAAFTAVLFGLLISCSSVRADAPRIDSIAPFGVQRGAATDVVIAGANLAGAPELIAPFGFKLAAPAAPNKDAGRWSLKIVADETTAIGAYVVRVKTEDGLSNPFLFSVGQLPQAVEKEDNSTFESAQVVTAPCVVEGQASGSDVDFYRFKGKKGQRVLVDAQCARIGSGLDPTIRLTTAGHKYVGSADDTPGLLTDARLAAVLPEDGDYVVEISDTRYQGGKLPIYRLVLGEVPVADEIYPLGGRQGETVGFELRGGTLPHDEVAAAKIAPTGAFDGFRVRIPDCRPGRAVPLDFESLPALAVSSHPEVREPTDPAAPLLRLLPPVVINGRMETKGDEDRFVIATTPGQKYRVEVVAADLGSALDGVLQVRTASNGLVASADDATAQTAGRNTGNRRNQTIVSPDPSLEFTAGAGQTELTLVFRDLKGDGGVGHPYRIVVEPVAAGFELALGESELSIAKGGTIALPVAITRRGYNGPVLVTVADPPKGLTVRPATIVDGQSAGVLTLTCAGDAAFGLTTLNVVGQSTGAGAPPLVVPGTKSIVFAQLGTAPAVMATNSSTQTGLPTALALPTPIRVDAPEAPVEVVQGYGAPVPLKVAREKDAVDAVLALAPIMSAPNQPLPAIGVPLALPTGLSVPNGSIAAKAADGSLVVNAAVDAPLGAASFVVTAKGKVANRDRSFGVPQIRVNVVRPAALEIPATLEIKAGATVELKGKVVRHGPFKEPVTVKFEGLPAGLKADPVTVPADKSDFVAKVVADPKAAVASATAKAAPAFQINKKDYATPPSNIAVKVLAAK